MTPDQPNPPPPDTAGILRQLRERYRASAPQLAAPFRDLAAQLASDPRSSAAIDGVRGAAHRLHGTAGSYGFHDVSELATALEQQAARWAADPAAERPSRANIVSTFAEALEAALRGT